METKYTDKILALLDEEITFQEFEKWYKTHDYLEQPDILRELKSTIELVYNVDTIAFKQSKIHEAEIDAFEDLILTHKLSKEMLSIERESAKTQQQKLMEDLAQLRAATLFLFIHKKAPITLLMETAEKLIATEKQFDMYDSENWKEMF